MNGNGLQQLLAHLSIHDGLCHPGLTEPELLAFEDALGGPLPHSLRTLYRLCGGMRSAAWSESDHVPVRLMLPSEVIEYDAVLRESAETYDPSLDARYVFS